MSSRAKPTNPPAATPDDEATRVLERAALDASTPPAADAADTPPSASAPKVTAPLNSAAQVTQAFAVPSEQDETESYDASLTAPELPALGMSIRPVQATPVAARVDDPAATNYFTPIPQPT